MDEEQYRRRLSEVAEWRIPEVKLTALEKKQRGRRSNEEQYQEKHEQAFMELFDGVNPTHPIQVDQVKTIAEICQDCGRVCETGRRQEYKLYTGKKGSAWREKCLNCGFFKDPRNGRFNIDCNKAITLMNVQVGITFRPNSEEEDK